MDLSALKFNEQGLIPCVTQDHRDGRVLMVAYMNADSLSKTIQDGRACYFSRSRNKLWLKGEESGNFQQIKEISCDCDGDTILLKVEQTGGCSCHEGYRSCFFRTWDGSGWSESEKKVKDPGSMYRK